MTERSKRYWRRWGRCFRRPETVGTWVMILLVGAGTITAGLWSGAGAITDEGERRGRIAERVSALESRSDRRDRTLRTISDSMRHLTEQVTTVATTQQMILSRLDGGLLRSGELPDHAADRWLTTDEVAEREGVTAGTVREWIRDERIPAIKISGQWAVPPGYQVQPPED